MDTCFFDGSSGQMASPLADGASGIVRQQFGGIGAERGGESQQIPHIWLVAPGEPVGHGNLVSLESVWCWGCNRRRVMAMQTSEA